MVNYLLANAGDVREAASIPESRRSPGVGNGNPLQFSCLENPMDRGIWWATVLGVAESDGTEPAHMGLGLHCLMGFFLAVVSDLPGSLVVKILPSSAQGALRPENQKA